jgi:membrane protein
MVDVARKESTDLRDQSTPELVRHLTEQVSTLVRDEMGLARQELRQKGRRAGAGIGGLGAAGVFALYGGGALTACAIIAIAQVLRPWLAALIVGAGLLVLAGMAAAAGGAEVRRAVPPVPERTVDSVREDVDAVKGRMHR